MCYVQKASQSLPPAGGQDVRASDCNSFVKKGFALFNRVLPLSRFREGDFFGTFRWNPT